MYHVLVDAHSKWVEVKVIHWKYCPGFLLLKMAFAISGRKMAHLLLITPHWLGVQTLNENKARPLQYGEMLVVTIHRALYAYIWSRG